MNNKAKIYIAGMGMITPVGANTEMTAAAVRADVSAYRETDYFDKNYNKVKMAMVPDEALEGCLNEEQIKGDISAKQARMLQLAKLALIELTPSIPENSSLPLFLAGPEQLDKNDLGVNKLLIENIALQSGVNLDINSSRIISIGRAGGLNAIKLAFRYFESSEQDYVLVGGVDTFYDKCVVDMLDGANRLLCGTAMDGFVPGEGAGFLLLARNNGHQRKHLTCMYEPGIGVENGHMFSNKTYTGGGLSEAFSAAIGNIDSNKIKSIYSSLNGESYFSKEYGVAITRNAHHFVEDFAHEHPADSMGDLGAATGIVFAGIIASYIQAGQTLSPAMMYCSSDRAQRAATVIHNSQQVVLDKSVR